MTSGHAIPHLLPHSNYRKSFRQTLLSLIVAVSFVCYKIRTPPESHAQIDFQSVASRLMYPLPEDHAAALRRAPLRLVNFRKPIGAIVGENKVLIHVEETLECGHQVDVHPGEHEALIARRRRCHECFEIAQGSLPFPQYEASAAALERIEPILLYLAKAELKETDPWAADNYRVAWKTILYAAQGNPDPWNYAFSSYYGKNLQKALAAWAERDRHQQEHFEALKKAAQSAEAIRREGAA